MFATFLVFNSFVLEQKNKETKSLPCSVSGFISHWKLLSTQVCLCVCVFFFFCASVCPLYFLLHSAIHRDVWRAAEADVILLGCSSLDLYGAENAVQQSGWCSSDTAKNRAGEQKQPSTVTLHSCRGTNTHTRAHNICNCFQSLSPCARRSVTKPRRNPSLCFYGYVTCS